MFDLAFLNSEAFGSRVLTLFQEERLADVMALSTEKAAGDRDLCTEEILEAMECDRSEFLALLTVLDASSNDGVGSELAASLGERIDVGAIVHVDHATRSTHFIFTLWPGEGRLVS